MKVSQLYVYPVKSLRPTTVKEGILTPRGFKYDRHFMLLKVLPAEDGSNSTILKNMHVPHFPEMALFHTDLEYPQTENDSGKVIVTYHPPSSGSEPEPRDIKRLEIPLQPDIKTLQPLKVTMHQSPTTGYNMGVEYSDWFSSCFGYPVVLAYLGPNSREVLGTLAPAKANKKPTLQRIQDLFRNKSTDNKRDWVLPVLVIAFMANVLIHADSFIRHGRTPQTASSLLPALIAPVALVLFSMLGAKTEEDRITFADCAPYLVISETSVDNVSARLPDGTEMDRTKFRPNIVVSGAENAFEEDYWSVLTLGSEKMRLLLTGNCVRCQSLNVDYTTGKMGTDESGAVLKKLMKDRRVDKGARFSPVFGRYSFLEPRGSGTNLRVGDEVVVAERGKERTVLDWPGLTN